jgi:8-oxo-dGTP pyrophosphatase MutT (NUDIX family)
MGEQHEVFEISQWGVFFKDKKCLILKSAGQHLWELPGGRIDRNELFTTTPELAFRREIEEELGIVDFSIGDTVGWMIGISHRRNIPHCRVVYSISSFTGAIQTSFEHEDSKWISEAEIDQYEYNNLDNSIKVEEILKKAFAMRLYEKK